MNSILKNEHEYLENYQMLQDTGTQMIMDYYNQLWHDIKDQWVIGLKKSRNFGNNTNNRLEPINQTLKQVIEIFLIFKSSLMT